MSQPRILIAAGGTGGHVYPALAIAEALNAEFPAVELHYAGSVGLERELVQNYGLRFASYSEIRSGPLVGVSWLRRLQSTFNLVVGTGQSLWLVAQRRPNALLTTGGWGSLPVTFAAWLTRVPILIYLPDVEPGQMIRLMQRFAQRVAITVEETAAHFPRGHTVVTGYPLRESLLAAERDAGLLHFGLDPARQTLLVFGGSRGARSINQAVSVIVPELIARNMQIIHITGTLDWDEINAQRETLPDELRQHYHTFAYLQHEMGMALAVSDLVVSRAGASVLGEFPAFGLAAVLVPYPYAGAHQATNAAYLVERGAAVLIDDADLTDDLLPTVTAIFDDPARRKAMRRSAHALAQTEGARNAGRELMRLAGAKNL